MNTYSFKFIIKEESDIAAEAIYAIADDAHCGTTCGIHEVAFDREAESLEAAIRSALKQVLAAGCTVLKLEVDVETLQNATATN